MVWSRAEDKWHTALELTHRARTMQRCAASLLCLLLSGLAALPAAAQTYDFDDYAARSEAAEAALNALDPALDADTLQRRRSQAIQSIESTLSWLEGFMNTNDYADMTPDVQAQVVGDRIGWQRLLADLRVSLGSRASCELAVAEVDDLLRAIEPPHESLSEAVDDLVRAQEGAEACALRFVASYLTVEVRGTGSVAPTLTIDGRTQPTGTAIELPAGSYLVRAEAPGFARVEQSYSLSAGAREVLELTLSPEAVAGAPAAWAGPSLGRTPTADASAGGGTDTRTLGWVLLGSGAALAATGLTLDLIGYGQHQDIEDPAVATTQADIDRVNAMRGATFVLYGVGLAAAVTGAVLVATGGSDEPSATPPTAASVGFGAVPGGGLVTLGGSF
jgi:hypothetical protein